MKKAIFFLAALTCAVPFNVAAQNKPAGAEPSPATLVIPAAPLPEGSQILLGTIFSFQKADNHKKTAATIGVKNGDGTSQTLRVPATARLLDSAKRDLLFDQLSKGLKVRVISVPDGKDFEVFELDVLR